MPGKTTGLGKLLFHGAIAMLVLQGTPGAQGTLGGVVPPDTLQGLPLVFTENWENGSAKWEIFDQPSFKFTKADGNTFLQVPQRSGYQPPVRGPANRVIIRDLIVRDFILEARVRITEEPFRGHRGGLFIFGYQDPSNLYYTHFAEVASDYSNTFGKVAAAPRFTFYKTRTNGIPWTMQKWQTIRMVRKFKQGILEAYVDDMTKPVIVGDDIAYQTVNLYEGTGLKVPATQTNRYEWGRVGIGSFQGTMDYDEVTLWAEVKGAPTRAVSPGKSPRRFSETGFKARPGHVPVRNRDDKAYFPDGKESGNSR